MDHVFYFFSHDNQTAEKRSATVGACPQILYYLGLAILFIDEYKPSKIFKMASTSFEVTDVPF